MSESSHSKRHTDQGLGVLVVVAPQRADLVLASDVPHGEGEVLVGHCLDIKAWNESATPVSGET